jgi:hypothetical protein
LTLIEYSQATPVPSATSEKLLDLTPPSARVVTPEGEKDLPLAEVQAGMTLRQMAGFHREPLWPQVDAHRVQPGDAGTERHQRIHGAPQKRWKNCST